MFCLGDIMKDRNSLNIIDVTSLTADMCSYVNKGEWEFVYVPVNLKDDNKMESYFSLVVCPKDKTESLFQYIQNMNGFLLEDYKIPEEYCHISTFKKKYRNTYSISFDKNDNNYIHANYNDNFKYVENFFKSYIKFRNCLIDNNQPVKYDDLFQFYCSKVTGFNEYKKDSKKNKIKR